MADVEYIEGSDLPELPIEWLNRDGTVKDFSTGWTFQLWLKYGDDVVIHKSSSIGGFATSPNVQIAWDLDELVFLAVGSTYLCLLEALRDSDSFKERLKFTLGIS